MFSGGGWSGRSKEQNGLQRPNGPQSDFQSLLHMRWLCAGYAPKQSCKINSSCGWRGIGGGVFDHVVVTTRC